jgi:hypothetical protein
MFSAISPIRFAILDAIMVYSDMLGWAPLVAPFAPFVAGAFLVAAPAAFFGREAVARPAVRLTGAEATEAAGILIRIFEV